MSTGIPQTRHHATATLGLVTAISLERGCLPRACRWRAVADPSGLPLRMAGLDGMELLCAVSGPGMEAARAAADALVRRGARALLCIGVSGGLAPGLSAGDLVLAEAVLASGFPGLRIPASPAWTRQALAALQASMHLAGPHPRIVLGQVLSLHRPALGAARKEDLWRRTHALIADLESAGVAMAAAEAGLPLLVLRAVCDPPERDLPPELPRLLDERGRVRPRRLLWSIARKPALVTGLLASRREFSAAMASLRRAMDALAQAGALRPPAG